MTALLLLIPWMGNHFVEGWNWPPGAFVFFGTLLFGIGLAYELVTRKTDRIAYMRGFRRRSKNQQSAA